jgi:hypothetical protein
MICQIEATRIEIDLARPPNFVELVTDDEWAFRYCWRHLSLVLELEIDLNEGRPFPGPDPRLAAGKTSWPVVSMTKSIREIKEQSLTVLTPRIFWHHHHRLERISEPAPEKSGFCRICDWRTLLVCTPDPTPAASFPCYNPCCAGH